ncbi:hypothetical protein MUK42_14650 [Musa troglodytarum]|uniref:Uncharacterized protein n=1 Tax=Musa troglodytarum TaxID=320322 RepID=A0A9E7LE87_9LILI|nr:hypothetical protein MUK42_14650 [Musa troglodytarum]
MAERRFRVSLPRGASRELTGDPHRTQILCRVSYGDARSVPSSNLLSVRFDVLQLPPPPPMPMPTPACVGGGLWTGLSLTLAVALALAHSSFSCVYINSEKLEDRHKHQKPIKHAHRQKLSL